MAHDEDKCDLVHELESRVSVVEKWVDMTEKSIATIREGHEKLRDTLSDTVRESTKTGAIVNIITIVATNVAVGILLYLLLHKSGG